MASALTGLRNVKEVQPGADDCNMDLEGGTAMFDLLAHALANFQISQADWHMRDMHKMPKSFV